MYHIASLRYMCDTVTLLPQLSQASTLATRVSCPPRTSVPEDDLVEVYRLRAVQMVWKSRKDWGTDGELWRA